MNSGKLDNSLDIALQTATKEREKAYNLDVGYDASNDSWELLLKYSGDIDSVAEKLDSNLVKLLNNYAIMQVPEENVEELSKQKEVEYIEKPFPLIFASKFGRINSCVEAVQIGNRGLFGQGVLVAIIDSGIDYMHPDFINEDGTSRIVALWDQTVQGEPPEGYQIGTLYNRNQLNEAIQIKDVIERSKVVKSMDLSGHGTHVAGIACGNGRASNGVYRGVAPQSDMLIVKLGTSQNQFIPNSTQLIQGIDFCVRKAIEMEMPLAINLSYGNNYGSHNGNSLLEVYIDEVSNEWKTVIVIGTGNEGATGRHTSVIVEKGKTNKVDFAVPADEYSFNMQIWKNYGDDIPIEIIAPSGQRSGLLKELLGKQEFVLDTTRILLYYAQPRPSNQAQQIYIEFLPLNNTLTIGQWQISLYGNRIIDGVVEFWLPSGGKLVSNTRFLKPVPEMTLTIPSTAKRAISVGAYDAYTGSYANFSGRGYVTKQNMMKTDMVKPDLVAPGVNVMSTAPNGGYASRTGTSMAAPFVTGAAALLMEWGIVRNNDPYLYGDKVKAYLIKGAVPLAGEKQIPSNMTGWGTLCLSASLPGSR